MGTRMNVRILPEGRAVVLEHVVDDQVTGRVDRTEVSMNAFEAWNIGQKLIKAGAEASTQLRRAGLEHVLEENDQATQRR